jgi:hypothetical protein
MRRRTFIAGLGAAAAWPFAQPFAAGAQVDLQLCMSLPE